MKLRSRKAALYLGLAVVAFAMPLVPDIVDAQTTNEQQEVAEIVPTVKSATYEENHADLVSNVNEIEQKEVSMYQGIAIATAEDYVDVYSEANNTSEVVGKMYKGNMADIVEAGEEFTKIKSGALEGYVATKSMCFNEEAEAVGNTYGAVKAIIDCNDTNVYTSNKATTVLTVLSAGDEFEAEARCGDYIVLVMDGEIGYVRSDSVCLLYELEYGMTNEQVAAKEEADRIAAEEAARVAEEERKKAEEEEAARRAEEERQAKIQAAVNNTSITYNPTMSVSDEELWVLACVIDWESSGEPYDGKLAVANVILNRVRSSRYANTIKGVVYAKSQFSGVSDGNDGPSSKFQSRMNSGLRSQDSMKAAMEALSGKNNIGSYTSFRATYIANYDAYSSYVVIGNHCFY